MPSATCTRATVAWLHAFLHWTISDLSFFFASPKLALATSCVRILSTAALVALSSRSPARTGRPTNPTHTARRRARARPRVLLHVLPRVGGTATPYTKSGRLGEELSSRR